MAKPTRRQDLIKAIKKGKLSQSFLRSLTEDEKIFVELYREFPTAGLDRMVDAPAALVKRACEIPVSVPVHQRLRSLVANLVSDSWATPQVAGVRGTTEIDHRSLRFGAEAAIVMLRAEKQRGEWHFLVELSETDLPQSQWCLKVGSRTVERTETGLFEWSSKRPPKSVDLVCDDGSTIQLPEISWKRTTK
ncbi:MAG: hypothetical protein OEV49_09070 [candidate division Zixibacteria bacterium]|nr:hypothetical protein [candidate division Zixibacteria bacterium]MDH3935752.1 hypothetical protein [candidate division Zixibacteria bacterium]MDH4032549.1 hypothetical protein [candidate division Zixibacteria bacterium]